MKVNNQRFLKKLDIFLIVVLPIISTVLALAFKVGFLVSILLFYGPLSLWLSLRTPSQIIKTLLFSFIVSFPLGVFVDYIITVTEGWFIPRTIFPLRPFGVLAWEDFIWAFFTFYVVVIFYEHFLDKGKHELVDRKMKYLLWPIIIIVLTFLAILLVNPEKLVVPYAYLWFMIFFLVLPAATFLSFFPRLFSKYVKVASYFFLFSFLFELTGLRLGHWVFPGNQFIGWVELFGYRFPFEEFFTWFVVGAIGILSYYEFFDDDRK